jgi:hypothetical protein
MGDRRNVVVKHDQERAVALYTHWGGSDLPATLANALKRGESRWDDSTYLTRIIFSEMIQREVLSETGYGIEPLSSPDSSDYCEASPGYDLFVDVPARNVYVGENVYSFEGYVSTFFGKWGDSE